ncbi:DRTGG domain-containing protein [Lutispora thermophila]|uniref:DRTGG domain-containing protein n=1 Tax=Lutispora thermophila DSM 19022 TaxID=1122184 RepID=A0A1M6FR63_9FIRM|nr:DRTGG domain-containing protein [Lutispora thermophila]SHJ00187.1 DRTGG domain-containing protein [Lutispora thermophila DSM 19022]
MKIKDIRDVLQAEVLCGEDLLENEILYAFGSDLMSDVLAFVKTGTILLTGLVNSQVIRTAEMADINAIIFVRGKVPDKDVIDLARESSIIILTTKYTLFTASGILYSCGLRGIEASKV